MILGQMMMVGVRFCKHHYLGGGRLMLIFFFKTGSAFDLLPRGFIFRLPFCSLGLSLASARTSHHSSSQSLTPSPRPYLSIKPTDRAWGSREVSVYLRPERTWYLVTNPAPSSLSVCSSIIRLISHPRPSRCTG